jgi:osmotically-inducible protein OsmY
MTTKSDDQIVTEVLEIFDTISSVKTGDIQVAVDGGIVTLTGRVDTHQTRFHVERLIRQLSGMRGLQIHIRPDFDPTRKQLHLPRRGD